MRQEMLTIINQFQSKMQENFGVTETGDRKVAGVGEGAANQTERVLEQTNDKIDNIQQRFAQFQEDFNRNQMEFAETFKSLDERQKFYIEHVNEMMKNMQSEKGKSNVTPVSPKLLKEIDLTLNLGESGDDKTSDDQLDG